QTSNKEYGRGSGRRRRRDQRRRGAAAEEDAGADDDRDEEDGDEDEGGLRAIQEFNDMFANLMSSERTPDEPWPEDAAGVRELIDGGKDPFQVEHGVFVTGFEEAPFHQASKRRDLEILLLMAASPASSETRHRYFYSQGRFVKAPAKGRGCIPTSTGMHSNHFSGYDSLSFEGLEVMILYGYKLKKRDVEAVISMAIAFPDSYSLNMIMFVLASVISWGLADETQLSLEQSLGLAIGGEHDSFVNNRHPTNIVVAELLLQAGADPNGYCFQGETPYDSNPALYQAVKNNDAAMASLLMSYGAKPEEDAQVSEWTEDERGDEHLNVQTFSTLALATEKGMDEVMVPPDQIKIPNPKLLAAALARELSKPLDEVIRPILVVAAMRATGKVLPVGLVTTHILTFCPHFHGTESD
ncbi:hypothetical protein THAOC_07403, partial [Thalassiosira oceanica]